MIKISSSGFIDFVVTWVDDTDPVWLAKRAEYKGDSVDGNTVARYRDWDTLKYWFRGVEKFAPWVRYVYFVTDNQKPEWLNLEHPKLKWVKHTDFIPNDLLPVFSSHAIEWNLHRIEGLSDNFVYFNDDVFIINRTTQEDFFVDNQPCDLPCLGLIYPSGFFSNILFNNIELINRHFSLKKSIIDNLPKWVKHQHVSGLIKLLWYGRRDLISDSVSWHVHVSLKKKYFEYLWDKEYESVFNTCKNKFRSRNDISIYCVRDWQLLSGDFYPHKPIGKKFHTSDLKYSDEAIKCINGQKVKVICLNDTEEEKDFDTHKRLIVEAFEKILPDKSQYEL